MAFKVEINVKDFTKAMEEKQKEIAKAMDDGVRDGTFYVWNKVKESIARGINAPRAVDTGLFVGTVQLEPTGKNEARVFSDLEYSKYIEYGTSKMQSRPHFRNTAMVEKSNVKEVFANKITSK